MNCALCDGTLTERQRIGMHALCDRCLLASLENDVTHGEYMRQDDIAAHPPVWLPIVLVIAFVGFVWGMVVLV